MKIKSIVSVPATSASMRRRRGFTIMEIVIVLAIIGIILTVAVRNIIPAQGFAKEMQVKGEMNSIMTALQMYKSRAGNYPTQAQGLKALQVKPATPPIPKSWVKNDSINIMDPFTDGASEYTYKNPGTKNKETPEIISVGPDGQAGTDDDISSQNV